MMISLAYAVRAVRTRSVDLTDITLAPKAQLDYFDQQTVSLQRAISPLQAWNAVMAKPRPALKAAFGVRDRGSSLFGVRTISGFSSKPVKHIEVGQRLDFFLVEQVRSDLLVLTERDKHLDVMTTIICEGSDLSIISSVVTHNWFGKAYMVPVGIAHRYIVKAMLRDVQERFASETD